MQDLLDDPVTAHLSQLTIQALDLNEARQAGITLYMARADLQHPLATGNKFYKLLPVLEYAHQQGINHLVSFGGAFSNHIHALALLGQQAGFKTSAIIRGEPQHNPTLDDARNAGMQLEFISRKAYRKRAEPAFVEQIQHQYPGALLIPEGGNSPLAIRGCIRIAQQINEIRKSDILTIACGTGATLAGLVCGLLDRQKAIGYAVLKDESLSPRVETMINNVTRDTTIYGQSKKLHYRIAKADFGGYAKLNKPLLDFIFNWRERTSILLDPVYTAKMCMRIMQQIEAGEFAPGTSICMVHSGGLQGWRGMHRRVLQFAGEQYWNRLDIQ